MSWNTLAVVPGVVFPRLKNLEVLKLPYNEIETVPEEIGLCTCARR